MALEKYPVKHRVSAAEIYKNTDTLVVLFVVATLWFRGRAVENRRS
jgi:hypothetical protein